MIISNKPIQRVGQVYNEQARVDRARRGANLQSTGDKVTLSTEGKDLQIALKHIKAAEEIRPKAEELRQAVKSGTYRADGQEIAASMIKAKE